MIKPTGMTASTPTREHTNHELLQALSTAVEFGSNHQQQRSTAPHVLLLPHLPGPAMQVL